MSSGSSLSSRNLITSIGKLGVCVLGPLLAPVAIRLGRGGWVDDDLPYSWFAGGANHLDPVNRRWALRHADDLGVDEATFEVPEPSGG